MGNKPKLLIVDDKPENIVAIETVLRDLDLELIKATNGNDALKAALHHKFILALLDIQMPEMDGYELAGILREEDQTSNLPFIFISAVYTDNLNIFKGYEKGAFSYITKPFPPEALIQKVNFFLEKSKHESELYRLNKILIQKNAELEYYNKELESFSYSVSHDLRTPLIAINGYASMLLEKYSDKLPDNARRYLGNIQKNAINMNKLIDGLLSFSRLGKKMIEKKKVDLKKMVEDIWLEMQKSIRHKVSFQIDTIPPVQGDYILLKQVMTNLISNAIKYSSKKDKAEIEVGYIEKNNEIAYFVKDNGAGFDMKYADKLFGVFQRLHPESEFEGTGVGLALVQRIINKHGGKIWAESKKDEGATFWFTLS